MQVESRGKKRSKGRLPLGIALTWASAQTSDGEWLKGDLIGVENRPAKRTLVIPSPPLESVDDPVIVADAASFESLSERDAEAMQAKGALNKPVGRQADVTSGTRGISASIRIRRRSFDSRCSI